MTSNDSVQFHQRFVTEKHNELISSLNLLVNVLVSENIEKKKTVSEATLKKALALKASMSKKDSPPWLVPLIKGLEALLDNKWQQADLMNSLIKNLEPIRNHKWVFDDPDKKDFDFDAIFEHYKSQSRLSELFDEIIKILEEIKTSGEVDSLSMMTALSKVISTLKQNKDGSYFSLNSAWSFLISFLKNCMWAELAKVPVLGPAMEALEKTINEANDEMFKVHSEIQNEMKNTVEKEVKALQKKTNFEFVVYNKSGATLPKIEDSTELNARA